MIRTAYGIICIIVSIYCMYVVNKCREKKKEGMYRITRGLCFAGGVLVLFNAGTLLANTPLLCSFFLSCMLVCADLFMYMLLEYTLRLTGIVRMQSFFKIIILSFVFVDALLILSNPWTEFALTYEQTLFHGDLYYVIEPQVWYFIHCAYIYLAVVTVIVLLLIKCFQIPLVYCGRYLVELSVVLCVVIINLLYLVVFFPVDLSCLLYAWAAHSLYKGALEYQPKFLRRHARYIMANKLQEPILLFDINNHLADYNKEAEKQFDLCEKDLGTMSREVFETDLLHIEYEENFTSRINREVTVQNPYETIHYHFVVQSLRSARKKNMGKMYVFQDISKQKMMYNALENMSSYDQLTGFYTDRAFANKIAEWDKSPKEYVIAICNIAGLKLINAFFGREAGNSVIQRMSEEVRDVLPEDSLICYADEDCTVIVVKDKTEEQVGLYLSAAARKLYKRGLDNVPVYMNYGIARRENTSVSIEEYIKYAVMDLLLKKGKDGVAQKSDMTRALTEIYFKNEYESAEHVERITEMASGLAKQLQLPEKDREKLELLCRYHDIGRVKTREDVWSRAAVITRDELDIVKLHSITGYQIASCMALPQDIADLILHHHENFDGSGYPYGVSGDKIPLLSRILSIIDAYDIMIHDRLYKEAVTEELALEELHINEGTQFDPALVNAFETFLKERK